MNYSVETENVSHFSRRAKYQSDPFGSKLTVMLDTCLTGISNKRNQSVFSLTSATEKADLDKVGSLDLQVLPHNVLSFKTR